MKIAILGTRGVPAAYSGFETCAEELGARLAEHGHSVTVYCRAQYVDRTLRQYRGMSLVFLPCPSHKYLETFTHTLLATALSIFRGAEVLLYFGVGNAPFTFVPRLVGKRTVINVDGLDWRRKKWGPLGRVYLCWCERLALVAASRAITDSEAVASYYKGRYGRALPVIRYGAREIKGEGAATLKRLGLSPRGYVLYVGRLVPENCVHHLIDAYRRVRRQSNGTTMKLVIVGDAPYSQEYIAELKAGAGDEVVFTGYVFNGPYADLGRHCYLFVEPSEVGGTHPALVEAMGFGCAVLANGTPSNLETIGDAGFSYDGSQGSEDLAQWLGKLLRQPDLVASHREKARARAEAMFRWDQVVDSYEALFQSLQSPKRSK